MTPSILKSYDINRDTVAIVPAYSPDYDTIVYETDHTYYVKELAHSMIERACIEGGATCEGRRDAVSKLINVSSKIPIPIDPLNHIYAFPTNSPSKFECNWIFYHHIHTFKKLSNKTLITFMNHHQLTVDITHSTFEKQVQRTSFCIVRLTQRPVERKRRLEYV
ncbi:competence protein ComK [Alkalihalophilus pseudofirmus]|uniref:competence protein ComK n=1 Tax=Alkalihalophilus pseudofirmus TaxID=79885 RepID=UPI0003038231|nr:competence protein ComK [Alkalihalophilus pseudofirmus]